MAFFTENAEDGPVIPAKRIKELPDRQDGSNTAKTDA